LVNNKRFKNKFKNKKKSNNTNLAKLLKKPLAIYLGTKYKKKSLIFVQINNNKKFSRLNFLKKFLFVNTQISIKKIITNSYKPFKNLTYLKHNEIFSTNSLIKQFIFIYTNCLKKKIKKFQTYSFMYFYKKQKVDLIKITILLKKKFEQLLPNLLIILKIKYNFSKLYFLLFSMLTQIIKPIFKKWK
jgi:hypothetical protein